MKNTKKLLAMVLCIALILALVPSASAAAPTLTLDKSTYGTGETITVTTTGITDQMVSEGAYAATPVAQAASDISFIPDPNFAAAVREVLKKPNGEVTTKDVAGIKNLSIYTKNISTLSGIEYFVSLTNLDCDNNPLTTLDVSSNTALVELRCERTQLTTLDVSKNTELTHLHCNGNPLTTLDVSNNTELKLLRCGRTQLTTLDVSNNTELVNLQCDDNQLTTLDVSNNSKLERLHCYGNPLTSLDVSNNPALFELECGRTQLTTLDVSKNTALTNLQCERNQLTTLDLSNNTVLIKLNCSNNQLTSLDVSNNTELAKLRCGYNQLTTLDVSNNSKLEELVCYRNYMADKSAVKGFPVDKWDDRDFWFGTQITPEPTNPIDTASDWAKDGITAAIGKGFVPADIQGSYTNVITRAEFCRMAVKWVEYATGKSIDAVLAEAGKSRDPNAFTDVTNSDILAAAALGITSGVGNNRFDPGGQFTRQQAATMIMNTCQVIGTDTENPPPSGFADMNAADGWAHNGINFVRAHGIMSGTGDGFNPKGIYTRQEAIITFNNVKR